MNRNHLAIILGIVFFALLGALYFVPSPSSEEPPTLETGTLVRLYFYNPALDQGPGGVQCSEKGLVSVERVLPTAPNIITDTLALLLRGKISDEEQAQGIESEFPLDGVVIKETAVASGVLTITLDDPQNKTSGGACRVSILRAQIETTAKQFPEITSVEFLPEEVFQP